MRTFFLSAFCFFCASCSGATAYDAGKTKAEAAALLADYALAISTGDFDRAASTYDDDEDFHWIDRGMLQYASASDAAASLKSIAQPGMKSVLILEKPVVADLSENAALASVRYRFDQRQENGDPLWGFDAWMTVGLVKRDDGWKIAARQAAPAAAEESPEP
ncbi:MAG TPA: DUF4440 domain-containing protein [Parvularculaceae bacterium]|nr:DUF4440 domain-containing protein [Parvularculaceae bacterium]